MGSHWLAESEHLFPRQGKVRGDLKTDVLVVGGGFVGLWTAIHLRQLDPTCDVVLVEQNRCGHGASGLNGGFAMSWWPKIASLCKACGDDDAVWLADQTTRTIQGLQSFLNGFGHDVDLMQSGWLWTATTPAHIGSWNTVVEKVANLGRDGVFQQQSAQEIADRTGSSKHIAGIVEPINGTVNPVELAAALVQIAQRLGVQIYEQTQVQHLDRGRPAQITTQEGTITADKVVLATNAWAASEPELSSRFVCVTSAAFSTEPIPERLADIGWTGGESITDSQARINYYRTTRCGRIVFGKGGGKLTISGRPSASVFYDKTLIDAAVKDFRRVYPSLADVKIERSWSGPIDRTYNSLPLLGHLRGAPNINYGVGWSGNGVNPSQIGGRILAGLALERNERWTKNGLVGNHNRRFPPEPIRYLGGNLVLGSVRRKDAAEISGRAPTVIDRKLAGLGPSGLEDK